MARVKTRIGALAPGDAYKIARRACRTVRGFDYDDMVQECILELCKHTDKITGKAKAYGYCRMRVRQYWDSINRAISDRGVTWRELNTSSLNVEVEDGDGDTTELVNLLADSYSLQRHVEVVTFLKGLPTKVKRIAQRKLDGIRLTNYEKGILADYAKQIY